MFHVASQLLYHPMEGYHVEMVVWDFKYVIRETNVLSSVTLVMSELVAPLGPVRVMGIGVVTRPCVVEVC